MDYYKLLSFGDIIKLDITIDPFKLIKEVDGYTWSQYNPRKQNNRFGLSITSSDGELNNIDLDSLYEYNVENNTNYTELSFKTKTEVYHNSEEIQKLVDPFGDHLCRSHIINLKKTGNFPPHRDWRRIDEQESFRVFVPIIGCNPDDMIFIYDDKILSFDHGVAYFMNTNKKHSLFSFDDNATFIVLNIECNQKSIETILKHMVIF